jgi:hypothetical protein
MNLMMLFCLKRVSEIYICSCFVSFHASFDRLMLFILTQADAYRQKAEAEIRALKRAMVENDQALGEANEANANISSELAAAKAKIAKLVKSVSSLESDEEQFFSVLCMFVFSLQSSFSTHYAVACLCDSYLCGSQSEQYRTKLLQYMNEVTDLSSTYQVSQDAGSGAAASGEVDFQPALEKMQKEMIRTHRERCVMQYACVVPSLLVALSLRT